MAINTAEKRKSISGINKINGPGVTPNVSQDQEWRQESGFGYSGILAALPGVTEELSGDSEMTLSIIGDSDMTQDLTVDSEMTTAITGDSEL